MEKSGLVVIAHDLKTVAGSQNLVSWPAQAKWTPFMSVTDTLCSGLKQNGHERECHY